MKAGRQILGQDLRDVDRGQYLVSEGYARKDPMYQPEMKQCQCGGAFIEVPYGHFSPVRCGDLDCGVVDHPSLAECLGWALRVLNES